MLHWPSGGWITGQRSGRDGVELRRRGRRLATGNRAREEARKNAQSALGSCGCGRWLREGLRLEQQEQGARGSSGLWPLTGCDSGHAAYYED
ncbi:uncharacterized protein LOC119285919 isoform X3 [Triticum dicoccoides]|uniref:uncharacterized protein LOC119285919 isoform X3 n=1 Tax=Triticum dicoccoides TaxID=85692 RepID=UPI001890B391|nr:uncharacterized protein LOC119285919 isoform X3 [Triticum dicoccoides]